MNLNLTDPNGNEWNEAVLFALGASIISYQRGSGPVISPTIDLTGYAAVAKAYQDWSAAGFIPATRPSVASHDFH